MPLKHPIIVAGERLAVAVTAEMELENQRPAVKTDAIKRIMSSGDNPLTGKPHSGTSAEALVHTDAAYAAHTAAQVAAVHERILARAEYDAAIAVAAAANALPT